MLIQSERSRATTCDWLPAIRKELANRENMSQQPDDAYLLELPASLLQQVLVLCVPGQLACCAATCKFLHQAAASCPAWQQHCQQRWANWSPVAWTKLQQQGAWMVLYAARHQVMQHRCCSHCTYCFQAISNTDLSCMESSAICLLCSGGLPNKALSGRDGLAPQAICMHCRAAAAWP